MRACVCVCVCRMANFETRGVQKLVPTAICRQDDSSRTAAAAVKLSALNDVIKGGPEKILH